MMVCEDPPDGRPLLPYPLVNIQKDTKNYWSHGHVYLILTEKNVIFHSNVSLPEGHVADVLTFHSILSLSRSFHPSRIKPHLGSFVPCQWDDGVGKSWLNHGWTMDEILWKSEKKTHQSLRPQFFHQLPSNRTLCYENMMCQSREDVTFGPFSSRTLSSRSLRWTFVNSSTVGSRCQSAFQAEYLDPQ